jgi:hypothetical protein
MIAEAKAYTETLKFDKFDIRKELDNKRNFAMTITSKRRTGKSVLLKDLCSQVKDWYESVFVFSMSAHLQPDLFDFVPKDHIIQGFDEEKLKQIWNTQEERILKLKKLDVSPKVLPKILVLFDDIIGDEKVRHSQTLNNFFILGRHLQFAVVILTQTISGKWGLPGVIRSNVDVAISFFLDAEYDRKCFTDQYLSAKNKRAGSIIYEQITRSRPFQAIVVLNCVISQDITECVKTFIAREKLPKFKIGTAVLKGKMNHVSMFAPSSGLQGVDFLPKIKKS